MNFKIIVAMCKNRGIGIKNSLPWKIKEDLQFFSKTTKGNGKNAIVMGKNTWISLNYKPLKDRANLILSSSLYENHITSNKYSNNDYSIFPNIENLMVHCKEKSYETVWIIGGESIYKQFLDLNLINECSITYIDYTYECDTFFPELDLKWRLDSFDTLETSNPFEIWIHNYKLIN